MRVDSDPVPVLTKKVCSIYSWLGVCKCLWPGAGLPSGMEIPALEFWVCAAHSGLQPSVMKNRAKTVCVQRDNACREGSATLSSVMFAGCKFVPI